MEGWLERREGRPVLRVEGWEEPLAVAPLTGKVQWARSRKLPAEATEAERTAYARLLADWDGTPRHVTITGPVRPPDAAKKSSAAEKASGESAEPGVTKPPVLTILEVRLFTLAPPL